MPRYAAKVDAWPRRKFGNRKTVVDGITFDSLKEARRYQELVLLQKAGEVADLSVHPSYDLYAASEFTEGWEGFCFAHKIGRYSPDFKVIYATGEIVIEDVKSEPSKTTSYRLRKRIFEANYYPLTVREV